LAESAVSLDAAGRTEVLALVAERVQLRFALDAVTFADHLLDLWDGADSGTGRGIGDHVRRLSLDDLYLATACSRGDEKAWEELAGRHLGFLRGFARRFLKEPAATDVADQVLADLWQRGKIARYGGRSTLRTWLGAVVARAALNAAAARPRTASLEGEDRVCDQVLKCLPVDLAANQTRSLLTGLVAEAIGGLPPGDRLLLYLYYEQDLTLDQMALALHASKATLSRRLIRVRSVLGAATESLARRSAGTSTDALRAGIDLAGLELDLSDLVSCQWNEPRLVLSKHGHRIRPQHDEPPAC